MKSSQFFNNLIINSSKKDHGHAFLHRALTGGKLNSAHIWGDLQEVSVLTCSCSSASPSYEMHRLRFQPLNTSCRYSCWLWGHPSLLLALSVPAHPSHATAGPASSTVPPDHRLSKPGAMVSPCLSLTFTCPHPQWGAQCLLAALPLGVALARALQETLALTEQKTEGNFMRRLFTRAVNLKSLNTPSKVSYLELHTALHKKLEQPDWTTIVLLWSRHGSVHLVLSHFICSLTICFCCFPYIENFLFLFFPGGKGWEASMAKEIRKNARRGWSIFSWSSMFLKILNLLKTS